MLSESATALMECLSEKYKKTGINKFFVESYIHIPNHNKAIAELVEKGYISKKDNILETLSINPEHLKG